MSFPPAAGLIGVKGDHTMSSSHSNGAMYLLGIRGTLAPASVEAARKIHNSTAGAPENVKAARALGDLSHMVYVPLEPPKKGAGEFLILDIWNSLEGLNQFFANPTVQEQGGKIFAARDPVVWARAPGWAGYTFPTPFGRNDRIVALVRGPVGGRKSAKAVHDDLVTGQVNKARLAGGVSHDAFFRLTPPGQPESLEFFAMDVWMDAQGMGSHYAEPGFMDNFARMFKGQPDTSTWTHPPGDWVEW
jgi:hypothetical protein